MHNHCVCQIEISLHKLLEHPANFSTIIPVAPKVGLHLDHHFHLHLVRYLKSPYQQFLLQISVAHFILGVAFRVVPAVDGFKEMGFGQGVALAVPGTMAAGAPATSGHRVIGQFTGGEHPPAVGRAGVMRGGSGGLQHSYFIAGQYLQHQILSQHIQCTDTKLIR